ncbi:aminoacyl tRNA synthase complex-interacting multifunctional protein 2-like [Babylonia areolata]|uniref:aminoacyl tRNA synthase complex-interacting multifunctional protein 2-like n=1 Tax=Babylonia areolata TaxID=304850 RepID=UPI003FD48713
MASATGKMYQVKPFINSDVEIITNVDMYKVKKIGMIDMNGIPSGGEVEERLQQLQQRQQKVLTELQQLQHSVQELAERRGVDLTTSTTASTTTSSISYSSRARNGGQGEGLQDLVISADPSSAPLSLLVLLKQLSSQRPILTSTFVHSSAVDTPSYLRSFLYNGSPAARSTYQLAITLVWKKMPRGPTLMVSPTQQTSIQGEANIARYLSRLMRPSYEEADVKIATRVDEMLDLAQLQLIEGSNKERSAALRTLNATLGKSSWLLGGEMSLADIVTWSALQETKVASDAPANVKKWLQQCAQHPEFKEAMQFLQC